MPDNRCAWCHESPCACAANLPQNVTAICPEPGCRKPFMTMAPVNPEARCPLHAEPIGHLKAVEYKTEVLRLRAALQEIVDQTAWDAFDMRQHAAYILRDGV